MSSRSFLFGVDESGTSAFAGPILVVACYVPSEHWDTLRDWGFTDSKRLTFEKRAALLEQLEEAKEDLGIKWAISSVEPIHVDLLTPLDAQFKASRTACLLLAHRLGIFLDEASLIIDGDKRIPGLPSCVEQAAIPKADVHYLPVSVASVLAQHQRDLRMLELDASWPLFNFAENKGYGTLEHFTVILKVGPVYGVHRKHHLRKALQNHYDTYLKHTMRKPAWLKEDRWLVNVPDSEGPLPAFWPVINPDHPVYRKETHVAE